jgi:dihydrodipicolinate synthase/N-acetylneuraminate lyase
MNQLHGILAPVVTTFQPNGDVDTSAFAENIRAHLSAGLHGIVVTGSTGEAALLDEAERASLIETARREVPRDKFLLAGTGAESTRGALRLTKLAARAGADAVLVVAPHYYGAAMTAQALASHYRRIADESPVPVVLYNIPKYMHFALAPTLVVELAGHGNIVGIKDSSGDLDLLATYINAQRPTFTVMTGNGSTVQPALAMGARGGILAVSLFAPRLALGVYGAMQRGDVAAAKALQDTLRPINSRIVGELAIAGIKAALDRVGLHGGPPRAPLLPLSASGVKEVAELLETMEQAHAA